MSDIDISVTCVPVRSSDVLDVVRQIAPFSRAIHVDIDDGVFAPLFTWPYTEAGAYGPFEIDTNPLRLDVHLMVQDAEGIGSAFAQKGATLVLGHIEAFGSPGGARAALRQWRRHGAAQVGLGVLFQTPLHELEPIAQECDVVHLMSIASIGTQGIPYRDDAPARIAEFHRMFPGVTISVDGGVSSRNIADLVRAGATRFGVGSAIARAPDPAAAYQHLLALAREALG